MQNDFRSIFTEVCLNECRPVFLDRSCLKINENKAFAWVLGVGFGLNLLLSNWKPGQKEIESTEE